MSAADSQNYIARQVRRLDHERYFATLFAPRDRRQALLALYAFNLDIATIRETVTEPLIGQMRLQWWRDAIAAIHDGRTPEHPVAAALADAIARHDLAHAPFDLMIDARERDIEDESIPISRRWSGMPRRRRPASSASRSRCWAPTPRRPTPVTPASLGVSRVCYAPRRSGRRDNDSRFRSSGRRRRGATIPASFARSPPRRGAISKPPGNTRRDYRDRRSPRSCRSRSSRHIWTGSRGSNTIRSITGWFGRVRRGNGR